MMRAVNEAILALPEQQRLAIILRRYDEFSYEEIAEVLQDQRLGHQIAPLPRP